MAIEPNLTLVDLTAGRIVYEKTPPDAVRAFLGGRGLNVYYLYKYLPPRLDPLSPDNVLIFGPGLLTGTLAPSGSRMNVTAKSPESGILGDSNTGGHFAAKMRAAGHDRLIFFGRAEHPVYLYLENGRAELRDARHLWGLNARETRAALQAELGPGVQVACIGRAGEKRVRMAAVMTGPKAAAGRGGLGAVMGSKHLKAVVAADKGQLPVADWDGFLAKVKEVRQSLADSHVIRFLGQVGTPLLYEVSNHLGAIRTHNSQLNAFDDSLDAAEIEKLVDKMVSCFGCNVHCRHVNKLGGQGPEYSTVGLLGANLGISGAERVIELNNLCNDLGLDTSSTGTIIGWAMELYQRGLIGRDMTGGHLAFGDYELVRALIEDIADRRGFGDVLAESSQALRFFPPEAADYLIAVKGLPQSDPHDVRYIKAFALGIAVASRGADHLRNRPTLEIFTKFPAELLAQIYGRPVNTDMTAYDTKEVSVAWSEEIYAVGDALGLCRFITHGFNSPHLTKYEHMAELVRLGTGLEVTPEELRQVGQRIVNLERVINVREGVTRADDTLPKRYFDDPMPLRRTKGHRIDRQQFQAMLTRYYALRDWDENGLPPVEVVSALNSLIQPAFPLSCARDSGRGDEGGTNAIFPPVAGG